MKNTMRFLLTFALLCPLALSAQSGLTGNWKMEVPDDQGQMMTLKLSIQADGTYTIDFGNDGAVDINGKYETTNDQITIWDVSGGYACPSDRKGVYQFQADEKSLTMTRISEACEARNSPESKMVFQRM